MNKRYKNKRCKILDLALDNVDVGTINSLSSFDMEGISDEITISHHFYFRYSYMNYHKISSLTEEDFNQIEEDFNQMTFYHDQ